MTSPPRVVDVARPIAAPIPSRVDRAWRGVLLAACLTWLAACGRDAPAPTSLSAADQAVLRDVEALLYRAAYEQVPPLLADFLARDPVPVEAAYLAGQCAYYLQDYEECVRRLDDALARAPERYLTRSNALGFAHIKRGDYAAARAAFQRIVDADPDESKALYGLALVALTEGRLDDARPPLERSLRLRPDYLKARFAEVRLLDAEGRTDEALERNASVLREWPSNEEALFTHVTLLRQAGRTAEADAFEERRAQVYAAKEQIASLVQRVRAGDDDIQVRRALVGAYMALGDVRQTREVLLAALTVHPDDPALLDAAERVGLAVPPHAAAPPTLREPDDP